jgi:hypothetical protein
MAQMCNDKENPYSLPFYDKKIDIMVGTIQQELSTPECPVGVETVRRILYLAYENYWEDVSKGLK